MLAVKGVYKNGELILEKKIKLPDPVHVIVTFLDVVQANNKTNLDLNKFSFSKAREVLVNLKSSLSDTVLSEREENL